MHGSPKKIVFAGVGNMGSAIIQGLVHSGVHSSQIFGYVHSENSKVSIEKLGIEAFESWEKFPENADFLFLAVKPHLIETVCKAVKPHLPKTCTVVSVAAGVKIENMAGWLGSEKIIRCMPNTPIAIGKGVCGVYAHPQARRAQDKLHDLLKNTTYLVYLKSEDDFHKITALSGSAPAYYFYFMEAMLKQAEEWGFSGGDAANVILNTILGSALLAEKEHDVIQLKKNVTSKGGTTEAALNMLEKNGASKAILLAMQAAYKRSEEIANSSKV